MNLNTHSYILIVQNIKNEFSKYCQFITSVSKTISSFVPKNFSIQSIESTALTMMRLRRITKKYFQIFLFLIGKAFRDISNTKPHIQLKDMPLQYKFKLIKTKSIYQKLKKAANYERQTLTKQGVYFFIFVPI